MEMHPSVRQSMFDAFKPSIIMLAANLYVASFPLMKLYPAYSCIMAAKRESLIDLDTQIIESSSGTMALGLAIVCRWFGYSLSVVTDGACAGPLQRRLQDLGAQVDIVDQAAPTGGIQRARLDRLAELRSLHPNSWWVNQYDNPGNREGYRVFAAQVLQTIGAVDCLVGSVGSGGSMCGTASFLRLDNPGVQAIAVDTFNSVLFGQSDGPRALRGLGNSILPNNLDHTVFDEVHWITAAEAFAATRNLHRQTGLFRGGTSGAAWLVAREWASRNPGKTVLCLLPDDGHRYQETIYSEDYLVRNGLWLPQLPRSPRRVTTPDEEKTNWCYLQWGRRLLSEVLNRSAESANPI